MLDKKRPLPKLRDYAIYLGVKMISAAKIRYALIQIPTEYSRFFILNRESHTNVILIDDLSLSFFEKIENSIKQRKKGLPVRFVYDAAIPEDLLASFQQFDHVVGLLNEASLDPKVKDVKINIYRVAENSEIILQIKRVSEAKTQYIAYVGTGNFNLISV